MASNDLVEKLDRKLLECGICLQRYKQPRGLPCLHSFCHECLEQFCKGKRRVLCPICQNPTVVPREGVSGFPPHFMANTLQETLDLEKLKVGENSSFTSCSNCNLPDRRATVRCLDCKEFFCHTCHAAHNMLKASRNHNVVNIEELQSGNVLLPLTTSQDQKCKDHEGETTKFYCKTCKKPVCRDCIVMKQHCRDHDYVILKEESKKQTARLVQLVKEGGELKKKCQDAIKETEVVEKKLGKSSQDAKKQLDQIHTKYRKQMDATFDRHKKELSEVEAAKAHQLTNLKEALKVSLAEVENACDLATKVTQMGSDYDIASIYPTISANLEELNKTTKPKAADEKLGYVDVAAVVTLEVPHVVGVLGREKWKQIGQFSTKPKLTNPYHIAVQPNGDLGIIHHYARGSNKYAKVFSQTGSVKYSFQGSFDDHLTDIAACLDNRYVLPDKAGIVLYDSQGNTLKKAPTFDVTDQPSKPWSLAVDSRGRFIAGLEGNTISIHHADGQLISKFATPGTPYWLADTPRGDIAASIDYKTLQLMDYSGNNIRVVKPPAGVTKWEPGSVCCSKQGEIFVVNDGHPKAVYCYTADGEQCLGCVITGLADPRGIAISQDGQKLFVAEWWQHEVKIFQRE